ncbi:hypothetical protein CB0940_08393 [Cercospora beticola]|uniref:Uncharacterized protein n=1 Tax=Cercospora beticola TaxID=122368 RepID=A0A2G5HQ32_CERBT|nr:hypothetical protein CB0940_08393 [Cercospora beticola]PIA94640.1 hypothetical protein CB0940_08393 [Cercospora beticola]WPB04968.1 hypothetical protein RHO25_009616 [Cercospora beticola]
MSTTSSTNQHGQGASHATDPQNASSVPGKAQEAVPASVEHKLPDALHDTNSNKETGKVSHATGSSIVPQTLQEGLPEKVEKVVPNAIHDTKGATFSDGSVGK